MTATLAVTEQVIHIGDEDVSLRWEDDRLSVKWFCGETYRFSPDDAREWVGLLDALRDTWVKLADSNSTEFYAILTGDGNLYADGSFSDEIVGMTAVPWGLMTKALARTLRQNAPEEQEE